MTYQKEHKRRKVLTIIFAGLIVLQAIVIVVLWNYAGLIYEMVN